MTLRNTFYGEVNNGNVTPSNHKLSYNPLSYIIDSLIQALKGK